MKKTSFLILLVLACFGYNCYGQEIKNSGLINAASFIPEESIFVHSNASLLFSGEYLYYKISCLDNSNSSLSGLSKIAYIELISEKKERIFRHKIKLENGLGQGEFFIPTAITTGAYKLISYTQWMKNGGENYYFQEDIHIVNPYKVSLNNVEEKKVIITEKSNTNFLFNELVKRNSEILDIEVSGERFKKRSPITLNIKNKTNPFVIGNYSMSVRKIDTVIQPKKNTVSHFNKLYIKEKETDVFYPELNGEIISGRVIDSESKLPVEDVNVALSILGKGFIFRVESTDENGVFDISVNKEYEPDNGIIQVLDSNREKYTVEVFETPSVNLDQLTFNSFKITSGMKEMILERSVNNQIENAYYSIKPDTIRTITQRNPFYVGYNTTTFVLDEYTHFPTVKETFLEVVENAGTTKNKSGDYEFFVRNLEDNDKEYLPLIFIDGLLIQDHKYLYEFNVRGIEKVSILQGQMKLDSAIYQGIIIVETKKGDFKNIQQGDFIEEVILFKPQHKKDYFKQEYSIENKNVSDRIPDFRTQLLWEPTIELSSEEEIITFFTSDVTGVFEIELEGFTYNLEPVSIKNYFVVEE